MPTVHNFSYTGGVQTIVVPPGVEGATLVCVGARGGGGNAGTGASIEARIENLVPGETLYIVVGGYPGSTGPGGYPDGGNGGPANGPKGGPGGGSTSIGRNSAADEDRILVGGAGGGQGPYGSKGGNAGHPEGGRGANFGGYGGTQVAGGNGANNTASNAGSFGQGGNAATAAGGGGGGWYGGGGGQGTRSFDKAGGGGSSYYDPTLTLIAAQSNSEADNAGHGSATITFDDPQNIGQITVPGPVVVSATLEATGPRRPLPRRAFVWVYGLDGQKKAVIT